MKSPQAAALDLEASRDGLGDVRHLLCLRVVAEETVTSLAGDEQRELAVTRQVHGNGSVHNPFQFGELLKTGPVYALLDRQLRIGIAEDIFHARSSISDPPFQVVAIVSLTASISHSAAEFREKATHVPAR